jgi:excisionase family DNA binding protein
MNPLNTPERHDPPKLLTPAEVAQTFRVDPKTVTRWASRGLLPYVLTLGGHRRYRADMVEKLAQELLAQTNGDG